jgi:hypothetical protein
LKDGVILMAKRNFRDFKDVERFLYKNTCELKSGKVTPAQATAFARLAAEWLKAHKASQEAEILRRLDGIEAMLKLKEAAK